MPRRTGIDTLFDNENVPTPEEMAVLANADTYDDGIQIEAPLDDEDVNQIEEGNPGEFGSFGEEDGMDEEEYQAAIAKGIENAENYIDMELSPDREMAARYYRGEPFGNEEDGRSQVVMTEVRDTVLALMPGLLRIFCGSTDAVEFVNNIGTPAEQALAQTAYINHIIHKDNEGFTIFYSAFKDALVRKSGIFTWWHEEVETVTEELHTGLNEEALALLQMEKKEASSEDETIQYEVEILEQRPDTTAEGEMPDFLEEGQAADPMEMMEAQEMGDPANLPLPPVQKFITDARVKKRIIKKRHRVAAVPPEEFILSPVSSSDIDEFPLVGRRQMKMIGELVALGHDEAEIREAVGGNGGANSNLNDNVEKLDRDGAVVERIFDTAFEAVDESSEYVKYCEVYVLIDKDGDGILERRKICTVGDNNVIIYDRMVDEMVPYAIICPDPEPHSPFGYSAADQTMDFQEVKSEIVRGVLDSLAESIVGRTSIVEGKVNIDDALSNSRDQLIRIKEQGAIQSLSKPFNGMNAIPVLTYFDDVKARRTGMTMSPAGLAADTLQSTSTDAVQATVDASQERSEMIARIFAETGIKRMFRGLLRQVVKHQDRKKMIRIRGRAVTVDPRSFNADLDLDTNVGLGRGTGAKKLQALTMVMGQQEKVFREMGPTNPFVGIHHISNAMEDFVREVGFNDVSRYMNVLTTKDNDAYVKMIQSQPKPPTPEELMYKANQEKLMSDSENKRRADMVKMAIAVMQNKTKQDRDDMDFYSTAAEILGKFGIEMDRAEFERERVAAEEANALADGAIEHGQQQVQQIQGPQE